MKQNLHPVIGIDLGTTYSAVAVYDTFTTQAEVIMNSDDPGRETVPSVVAYNPQTGGVIVGTHAKRNLPNDPANTVIEIKREMGEVFTKQLLLKYDPQGEGKFRPRDFEAGFEGDPVHVRFAGEWYRPQEISAFILMKMKAIAEAELGGEVRDAVVTVPAYFTESQKAATKEAALLAGLYPRQILPEPTAAAICYGLDQYEPVRKIYLVYDLGGGTFDVSIIAVEQDKIDVLATSGDRRLGGGDFDDAITGWALDELRVNHGINGVTPEVRATIKSRAEATKIALSTYETANLPVGDLLPASAGLAGLSLTREKFEELIDSRYLLPSLIKVEDALAFAKEAKGLDRDAIDAILLVGGSSKIPKVRERLLDYFKKDDSFVRDDLNPDTVVARGAAMMAHRFQESPPPFDVRSQGSGLMNVEADLPRGAMITEHTLGVELVGYEFSPVIHRGTNIPVTEHRGGYTNAGAGPYTEVHVYQGEDNDCRNNARIGVIQIGPHESRPAGYHHFAVTFAVDENGLLSVTVHHLNENKDIQARFEQPTGVGGVDKLAALREKLLRVFVATAPAVETRPLIPPPPSTVSDNVPAAPPLPTPVTSSAPATPPAPQVSEPAASAASPAASVPRLTVEVSSDVNSLIRRATKLLLSKPDPALHASLAEFVTALNTGADALQAEDLYDRLEDAYLVARTRTSG